VAYPLKIAKNPFMSGMPYVVLTVNLNQGGHIKLIRYEYPHTPRRSAINRLFEIGVPSLGRFGGLFVDFFRPHPWLHQPAVDLSVDGENFSITGTRRTEAPEGWRPLRRDLPEGDYRLNLRLNVPIEENQIHAQVENGVLDLILLKAGEVKPRKIKVS
jgi:hypothetical protein